MASAIIVAGGRGIRMGGTVRKQYLQLAGMPILSHTILPFDACSKINEIFIVVPEADIDFCRQQILSPLKLKKYVHIVAGGNERQNSVYNGIIACEKPEDNIVVIHDGVRPFIRPEQICACIDGAKSQGSCILGIPAFDTLKQANSSGIIEKTLDRKNIWLAQTPQAFQYSVILNAHKTAICDKYIGTDDAALVERLGKHVKIITGSRYNIKITTREDIALAEMLIQAIP